MIARAARPLSPFAIAAPLLLGASALLIGPAASAQTAPYRVAEISYDFDDDGVEDARSTLVYDGSGAPTDGSYAYIGDTTPDLFRTEDNDAESETVTYVLDGNGFLLSSVLDRIDFSTATEQFSVAQVFAGGLLTDSTFASTLGGATDSTESVFAYTGTRLDQVVTRNPIDDSLVWTLSIGYGADDLPDTVVFESPADPTNGIPAFQVETTYTFRADGQADDVISVARVDDGSGAGFVAIGGGSGDYVYDGAGRRIEEVFTSSGGIGAFPAEFVGFDYRKTLAYDGLGLLESESIDVDDDGSIEATRTFVWEAGDCVPIFVWAPNGRPEFTATASTPYVPGTGWQSSRNCPEPTTGLALTAGLALLTSFARRRRH
ncbi:MAG: PEP-CTERM sorting domain-containing protein [Myxococcota bacterium]